MSLTIIANGYIIIIKNVVKKAAGKALVDANEYDVDTDSPGRTDKEDDDTTE